MNFQPQNSSGGGNQSKYTPKNRGGQGAKKQQDKQPQPSTVPKVTQPTGWGDLYAKVDNTKSGGAGSANTAKDQKFKPFVPGAPKVAPSQSNESDVNELQKMISDSSQKDPKGESQTESTAQDQDDAILSIDQNTQRPLKFSNKNQPKNKRDPDFAMVAQKPAGQGQKKERQLEKTHASWVSGTEKESLNDLMRRDDGDYDQFAGKKTTYDETDYGYTSIDTSKLSRAQIDHAKKMEKEILQGDAGGNVHLAEERGQMRYGQQEDEEIQYSGVIRNNTTILKNPKKFKCFNKKTKSFENKKVEEPPFQGLLNHVGWENLQQKQEKQSKQNQISNKSSSQSHSSAPKAESVTGVYKGGGNQQISNTQSAYIKQQVNNSNSSQTNANNAASTMKIPSTGFTPSAKPFVPKNTQPFQPKEESTSSSQAESATMKVNQPSFTPKSEPFTPKTESNTLKSESQAFTPQSEQNYSEFKPNQSYNNYTPKNQQSQSISQSYSSNQNSQSTYQGENQNSGYQNRQNNQYQQKHGNQYNQNQTGQYQGNNFQQSYSGGGQMYQQKHNNYQNNQYGNYDNQGQYNQGQNYGQNSYQGQGQNKSYGSNPNYQQNNQQNQYRSVNNSNAYYQSNQQNNQQQWGQGNLYNQYPQQVDSQQPKNNNYNQSHGSQGQTAQATGGFQNPSSQMSMSATVFKPQWDKS